MAGLGDALRVSRNGQGCTAGCGEADLEYQKAEGGTSTLKEASKTVKVVGVCSVRSREYPASTAKPVLLASYLFLKKMNHFMHAW